MDGRVLRAGDYAGQPARRPAAAADRSGHITALGSWTAYLPGVAADGLTQASQAGVRLLPPWQGGLVFTAWAALIAGADTGAVTRRDIT